MDHRPTQTSARTRARDAEQLLQQSRRLHVDTGGEVREGLGKPGISIREAGRDRHYSPGATAIATPPVDGCAEGTDGKELGAGIRVFEKVELALE